MRKEGDTIVKTAAFIAVLTAGMKILGFVREIVLANFYGKGLITDAYTMSQSIPNILVAGLATAAATAYMPTLSAKIKEGGEKEGIKFTADFLAFLTKIVLLIAVCGAIFAKPLVSIFAPGYSPEAASLTAFYLRIFFVATVCNVAILILEAFLQYKNIFLPQILLGYVQSISVIVFTVFSAATSHYYLILGITLGYLIRAAGSIVLAKRQSLSLAGKREISPDVKAAAALALPIFIGGSVNQINTFVDRVLASTLAVGSVSALNYSNMLIVAISTFSATVLTTVIYPRLNKAYALRDFESMGDLVRKGLVLISAISLPFTLGGMLYSQEVISAVYERGAFTAADSAMTAPAFFYYMPSLVFLSLNILLTKVFYSLHDTKTAVKCSVISVLCNIALNLALIGSMKHGGLALATSIAQGLNSLLLMGAFKSKYRDVNIFPPGSKLAKIAAFSAVSVAASHLVYRFVSASPDAVCGPMIPLLAAIGVAGICYVVLLIYADFEELDFLRKFSSRGR